jgi:hypothetical protein
MIRVMPGLREQVFKRLELPEQLHQRYGATKVALLPKISALKNPSPQLVTTAASYPLTVSF